MRLKLLCVGLALSVMTAGALSAQQPTNPWPRYIPVRPDGTTIDPGAGGGGAANPYPGADYSTAAKQDTGNTSAASTATNTGNTATNTSNTNTSLGTDGAGTNPGTGVRGWLSGIYARLGGTLKTDGSATTQPVSATALPLPAGAAQDGTDGAGTNPGTGIRGWLSGIYARLGAALTVTNGGTFAVQNTSAVIGGNAVPVTVSPGQYNATLPTFGNGAYGPLALDSSGRLIQAPGAQVTNAGTFAVQNAPAVGATITTSQPSVTTTAAIISAAATYNHREIYVPATATASIFIGASGVTTTTGFEIPPGASSGDLSRFTGALYAIAASTQTVRLMSY